MEFPNFFEYFYFFHVPRIKPGPIKLTFSFVFCAFLLFLQKFFFQYNYTQLPGYEENFIFVVCRDCNRQRDGAE
jgi:hypothetical protein